MEYSKRSESNYKIKKKLQMQVTRNEWSEVKEMKRWKLDIQAKRKKVERKVWNKV